MASNTTKKIGLIEIPVTLPQIAESLRRLKKADLETLELLVDKRAMATLAKSTAQAKRGKLREL